MLAVDSAVAPLVAAAVEPFPALLDVDDDAPEAAFVVDAPVDAAAGLEADWVAAAEEEPLELDAAAGAAAALLDVSAALGAAAAAGALLPALLDVDDEPFCWSSHVW